MSEAPGRRHTAQRALAGLSLIVSVVAVVGIAVWVRSRDRANEFADPGVRLSYHGRRMAAMYADTALTLNGGSSGHRVIAVRSVTPVITENASQARVRVLVCLPRKGPILEVSDLGAFCRQVRPFSAGALDLTNYHAQLVLAITPRRPGLLRIEGCRITYADGPHVGTQQTGSEVVVRTRAKSRHASAR
jgi:hypothetical protein